MKSHPYPVLTVFLVLFVAGCSNAEFAGNGNSPESGTVAATIRIAAFNTALSREKPGELLEAVASGDDPKVRAVAEVLQRVRPDVVLLSEIDYDATGRLVTLFQSNYLAISQNGAEAIAYRHRYVPEVNTGQPSGADLDRNGKVEGPGDAYGWGNYPGHYGMVLLSRFPIDEKNIRTFREMKWTSLPDHVMPVEWYGDANSAVRLSSKTHADVPVQLPDGRTVRLLISHPTPPVFDGPEDRNGRRNHDEVRLWIDYLDGKPLRDDTGVEAALPGNASVVVLGDLNADPHDGDRFGDAINRLIDHPRLRQEPAPRSEGAVAAVDEQGGINPRHGGDPALDTADFPDFPPRGPGNLRADYVLPSHDLRVTDAGVFWPASDEPHAELVEVSDHRLVWVNVIVED